MTFVSNRGFLNEPVGDAVVELVEWAIRYGSAAILKPGSPIVSGASRLPGAYDELRPRVFDPVYRPRISSHTSASASISVLAGDFPQLPPPPAQPPGQP